jgi:hypothetical protein
MLRITQGIVAKESEEAMGEPIRMHMTEASVIRDLERRIAELQAIVDKLPETADRVKITPKMKLYWQSANPATLEGIEVIPDDAEDALFYSKDEKDYLYVPLERAFSTRKAALAAAGGKETK